MSADPTTDLYGPIDEYIQRLFVPDDPALRIALEAMEANQLHRINIPPTGGRLLYLLARLVGAARVLEIGTLGGYSAMWLARAVGPTGRVITLEADPRHAKVARASLDQTDLADRVEIRLGDGLASMNAMIEQGEGPFDFIFIDANKEAYPRYLEAALRLSHSGTVIVADNVIRDGAILRSPEESEDVRILQHFNTMLATDPRLESLILPLLGRSHVDGISISRVR